MTIYSLDVLLSQYLATNKKWLDMQKSRKMWSKSLENNQSTWTSPQMTEIIKLVDKDLKTGIINALNTISYWGLSGDSDGKNLSTVQETWVWSLVGKIPWRREWQFTSVFLPGKFHGQRSLADYTVHGVAESETTEQLNTAICY